MGQKTKSAPKRKKVFPLVNHKKHVVILGAGGFGISLAVMAEKYCDLKVTLWSPFPEEVAILEKEREHKRLLPGIILVEDISITSDLSVFQTADLAIIAVPSQVVRQTAHRMIGQIPAGVPVACVSKGLESNAFLTMTQIIEQELPENPAVALSGPSHAEEVSRGVPTTIVSASRSRKAEEFVQDLLMNETLRIYVNDDVLGVELGGAFKNIIAVAAGIMDGLEAGGDNAMAALMTRGITEIARLGVALGAKSETFGGLSGVGDLIVTCSSEHSRNRQFGKLIGQGNTAQQAIELVGKTVEGYPAAQTAWQLAQKHQIPMPITEQTWKILYENKSPQEAIRDLMERPKRHESESIWLNS